MVEKGLGAAAVKKARAAWVKAARERVERGPMMNVVMHTF